MALLRLRRYRVFVVAAAIGLFLLYRLSQNPQLNATSQRIIYKGYAPPAEPEPAGRGGAASSGSSGISGGGGSGGGSSSSSSSGSSEGSFGAGAGKDAPAPAKDAAKAVVEDVAPKVSIHLPTPHASLEVPGSLGLPTANIALEPSTPRETFTPAIAPASIPAASDAPVVPALAQEDDVVGAQGVLRVDPPAALQETFAPQMTAAAAQAAATTTIHWKKMPEHFPIPQESLIPLPSGTPKVIPRIQHRFEDETIAQREVRESRLNSVRREMQHAWSGYRQFAWTHDELVPIAQTFRDPFCGWAATMVDALDTLWIMGMYEEFDEAYAAVRAIDFTTTPYRSEIPVFETTIRYLGGLVAAYDVSGGASGNYPALLTKAVELAEILMGVFDTPNRMPILYYNWKPAFSSQPAAASSSSSLAEIGSLTMEFTRLAQLTGDNKYYDAIARIVDALEEWQSRPGGTALPGIFPDSVDASGCNRTASALQEARLATEKIASDLAKAQIAAVAAANDADTKPVVGYQPSHLGSDPIPKGSDTDDSFVNVYHKRDLGGALAQAEAAAVPAASAVAVAASPEKLAAAAALAAAPAVARPAVAAARPPDTTSQAPITANGNPVEVECIPMNLTAGGFGRQSFSMGGGQDSTYEYFPKQYLLLGGLEPKYQAMHEKVVDATVKHLLYRPMIEDSDRQILFSAKVSTRSGDDEDFNYHYEVTHLTCFLGGMFAMGGRIFDRPDDLLIGSMLADGCAWAYEAMPTGIMPEGATMVPCEDSTDCSWNETLWHDVLDPNRAFRDAQMRKYEQDLQQWELDKDEVLRQQEESVARKQEIADAARTAALQQAGAAVPAASPAPAGAAGAATVAKRDIGNTGPLAPAPAPPAAPAAAPPASSEAEDRGDLDTGAAADALRQAAEEESPSRIIAPGSGYRNRNKGSAAADSTNKFLQGQGSQAGDGKEDELEGLRPKPTRPVSHSEFVQHRIARDHLLPGFTAITDRRYILRPEAIESVWYMYRITGDARWQEKGWRMFEAVVRATRTEAGHSAVGDVTRPPPKAGAEAGAETGADGETARMDNMESFWLAETLKYFYLLFTTPDVVSLDEYVLNTEAHPFKRPV